MFNDNGKVTDEETWQLAVLFCFTCIVIFILKVRIFDNIIFFIICHLFRQYKISVLQPFWSKEISILLGWKKKMIDCLWWIDIKKILASKKDYHFYTFNIILFWFNEKGKFTNESIFKQYKTSVFQQFIKRRRGS